MRDFDDIIIMHYVYEIYDIYGSPVYVGETKDPIRRKREHTSLHDSRAKFKEHAFHVIGEYDTKDIAWKAQCKLQEEYGLTTDREHKSINGSKAVKSLYHLSSMGKKGGKTTGNIIRTCPSCGMTIKGGVYFRHIKKCTL